MWENSQFQNSESQMVFKMFGRFPMLRFGYSSQISDMKSFGFQCWKHQWLHGGFVDVFIQHDGRDDWSINCWRTAGATSWHILAVAGGSNFRPLGNC